MTPRNVCTMTSVCSLVTNSSATIPVNSAGVTYRLKPQSYIHVKAACIWGVKKYYDKKGEVASSLTEPVYLVGSEFRQIFWDEMVDDGLLTLAKDLMEYVYDIDTKAIIPPLEF